MLVEEKLADLLAIQHTLKTLIASCTQENKKKGCPVIDSLVADELP